MAFIGPKTLYQKNKIYPLEQFKNRLALVTTETPRLVENVCKHRQAIMISEPVDYRGTISCPLHGWTYDQSGVLIGEPSGFFKEQKCLNSSQPWEKYGLLFSEDPQIDWDSIPMKELWNPENYVYSNTVIMECEYDFNFFIEAVLDSYHIPYVHPGLSHFCDVSTYKQQTGKGFAFQTTNLFTPFLKNPSPIYSKFQEHIEKNYPDRWNIASIWLVLFPNIIIDYYPGTCIVYSIWPSEKGCKVILHYHYEDDIVAFDPEFIQLQQACFNESQDEDDILSIKYQQGRTDLSTCYTHPLETQIDDFYEQKEFMKFVNF